MEAEGQGKASGAQHSAAGHVAEASNNQRCRSMQNATSKDVSDSAARPEAWRDYSSVFTAAKAGMAGVDQDRVKRIVYEMSKDSAHFKNEERKKAQTDAKVASLQAQAAKLTPAELATHSRWVRCKVRQHRQIIVNVKLENLRGSVVKAHWGQYVVAVPALLDWLVDDWTIVCGFDVF